MFKTVLITFVITFLMLGCDCPCTSGMQDKSFENTKWTLESFGRKRMAVPKKAFIIFKDGKYTGHAGCNAMSGTYRISGDTLTLKLGVSTLMACANMRLETQFRQELLKVQSYVIKGDTLDLIYKEESVLRFSASD